MPVIAINHVTVRMYSLGTGDCLVLKFYANKTEKYTMMIDCGSCQGKPPDFKPYLEDLFTYVNGEVDLLVITHEHNDHVNGFHKCPDIFRKLTIKKAWMAWTEHPDDPDGKADDLVHKRRQMQMALQNAITAIKAQSVNADLDMKDSYYQPMMMNARTAFQEGLETLKEINLPAAGTAGKPLEGMTTIKTILAEKKVKIRYLKPGETVELKEIPGLKFYILGPPYETEQVYKHEKEGTDVYKRKMSLSGSALAATAFKNIGLTDVRDKDIPFGEEYIAKESRRSKVSSITRQNENVVTENFTINRYNDANESWRKIDTEWLNSAGSLALRLNSHINNTSLAMAIESTKSEKVILLPGDAEYGSWESWHAIKKWKGKGKNGKHLVEDLLNRTVFYKISHHLSFNGTPTKLGIDMMESNELAAMATLDRKRISSKWKGTMPNKMLLQDLMRRCQGKVFIMTEFEIRNAPSKMTDFTSFEKGLYVEGFSTTDKKKMLYKQYRVDL